MTKQYDQAYFDRWYRGDGRVIEPHSVRRSARLAVSAAEHILGRPVRTVLDVGCGEGSWRAEVRRARPGARYTGIDPSAYAVARYGRRRGIRAGTFAALGELRLRAGYDLILCADVLHYVPTADVRRGLPALATLVRGLAYLQVLTSGDAFDGDADCWYARSAAWYRREFRAVGLVELGLNCWTTGAIADESASLLELR